MTARKDGRLVSVWDDNAERGRQHAERYGANFTDDLEAGSAPGRYGRI